MGDHMIIDASRQPPQIRCTHCGAAQDLPLPMSIRQLSKTYRQWRRGHICCDKTSTSTEQ